MNADELVRAVFLKATGQFKALNWGDRDYTRIFNTANFYIAAWQNEPNVDWGSLYNPLHSLGISRQGVRKYELDTEEVSKLSDIPGDSVVVGGSCFVIIPPELLKRYEGADACTQYGGALVFARDFAKGEVGKAVQAPVYVRAEKLKNSRSKVPVDDPYWLVTICAAEYSRSDTLLQNQYPNLLNEANHLMEKMVENNGSQVTYIQDGFIPGVSNL